MFTYIFILTLLGFFQNGECGFARIGQSVICTSYDSPNDVLNVSVKYPVPIREEQDCWLIETGEKDFSKQPIVVYPNAEFETNYTLIFHGFTDLLWLVSNIAGEDLAVGDISKGKVMHHFVSLDTDLPKGEKYGMSVLKQTVSDVNGNFENSTLGDFKYIWGQYLCKAAASICFYN